MLDIKYVREHAEAVKENLSRRQEPQILKNLDEVLKLDVDIRKLMKKGDDLRSKRNSLSKDINKAKKAGKDVKAILEEVKSIPDKIKKNEAQAQKKQGRMRELLLGIPNLLHESVPFGKDDTDNKVVSKTGKKPTPKFKLQSHVDIIKQRNLVDLERGAKIAGARWYYLKGKLAVLEMALMRYGVDFLLKKGFELVVPPFMISRKAIEGCTSLGDFEDVLYKIEGEDLYPIATSEHPLVSMYMDEIFDEEALPLRLAGSSTCFRKEAGSHGKDTKGIFRVHQFNKVEQIIICKPEDSWKIHEELRKIGEDFFESLGLHFHTVNVCTGDLGIVASKKYDVECWMPVQKKYREVQSCSNCTDYQANRLNMRYQKHDGTRLHVHTLNNTLVATARALVAIIENFQNEDGSVNVPKVLHKYTGFKVF